MCPVARFMENGAGGTIRGSVKVEMPAWWTPIQQPVVNGMPSIKSKPSISYLHWKNTSSFVDHRIKQVKFDSFGADITSVVLA